MDVINLILDPILLAALAIGLAITFFIVRRTRRTQRLSRRRLGIFVSVLAMLGMGCLIAALGYRFWYFHRPIPPAVRETLFQGVTYIREVRSDPRPMIIHVLLIDLTAPGIKFLVTPPQPIKGGELPARTTSQFLKEFGVQVAINGGNFEPWHATTPWDYYPHVGDPVNALGFTSSDGNVYSTFRRRLPTLYISADNQASFQQPVGAVYNAISGLSIILQNGKWVPQSAASQDAEGDVQPRTGVALDKEGHTLILIVVDGRQPNYSEGATVEELADIALQYGADTAMNQDGGGSSTMVMEDNSGDPVLLNSPIDADLPGRERAIGNQLGIFALPEPHP